MKASMVFNFCPQCGKKGAVQKHNNTVYGCAECGWRHWNNGKATVAIVFVRDGKMLVSKRAIEPKKGYYDLPGGFVDFGESAYDAVIREAKEETGVSIKQQDIEIIDIYFNKYFEDIWCIDMAFLIHKWSGEFTPTDDSESLVWKDFDFVNDIVFSPPYQGLEIKLAQRFSTN